MDEDSLENVYYAWEYRIILAILYFHDKEIFWKKLCELFYLAHRKLKSQGIDEIDNIGFCIYPDLKDLNIVIDQEEEYSLYDKLCELENIGLITIKLEENSFKIILTEDGSKVVETIINDPEFKKEIDIIKAEVLESKKASAWSLYKFILEILKDELWNLED